MNKILNYAKAVVSAVGAVVILVIAAVSDEAISFDEASGIWAALAALVTVIGVYGTPNREG